MYRIPDVVAAGHPDMRINACSSLIIIIIIIIKF